MAMDMDIDLVYLWVDGSDPAWQARKAAFLQGIAEAPHEATHEARFVDNDELRFSLRSVERYAPWIRHIYIITDRQVPSWLDTECPRVTIVDHTEILPPSALPTFSSPAIEWCVDNIPGLADHFLLANDDTLIAQEVAPDFFFNAQGHPIVRLRRWPRHKLGRSLYLRTIGRAQQLIRQRLGTCVGHIPHHNIDAYLKRHIRECKQLFAQEIEATVNRHIRGEEDVQRVATLYYALARGEGEMKLMGRYNKPMSLWSKLRCALRGVYHYDTRCINIEPDIDFQSVMDRYNPVLVCINDNEQAGDKDRLRARRFLEQMFPDKSSFER